MHKPTSMQSEQLESKAGEPEAAMLEIIRLPGAAQCHQIFYPMLSSLHSTENR